MSVQNKFLMSEISEFSFVWRSLLRFHRETLLNLTNVQLGCGLIWPHQLHKLHTMVHFFKQRFSRNLSDKNKDQ